ncbi:MAG: hypothetical protein J6V44_12635 [Methanobrevibacter sp.]|jgi:hypothetical protein|nr:hypothetical protein [Methanobrevibacter sp.]
MDLSTEELQKAYNHCTDMLFNKNKTSPGKYTIKRNIAIAFENCNAELFMRYLQHDCNIDILKTNSGILSFLNQARKENNLDLNESVAVLFTNLPPIFENVTIDKLMSACFDKLDIINRKMISDKFIIGQGIWLTEKEKEDLTEYDDKGKRRDWKDVIKERLILNPELQLLWNPNGFSYTEFRALVKLDPFPKISSLPTTTLKLLRDKVLLLLDYNLDYHINKWTNLMKAVEAVAEYKQISLTKKEY